MIEYVTSVLTGQFSAALCMLDHCVRACPPAHWEGKIANGTFRWAAYHTLFFVDLYLSPGDEDSFVLRDLHRRGGDEREDKPCGISFRKITRGELHIYNLRHVQHHAGQLSAYLRRVDPALDRRALPWIETGWK
jgi:hypothetical protein